MESQEGLRIAAIVVFSAGRILARFTKQITIAAGRFAYFVFRQQAIDIHEKDILVFGRMDAAEKQLRNSQTDDRERKNFIIVERYDVANFIYGKPKQLPLCSGNQKSRATEFAYIYLSIRVKY